MDKPRACPFCLCLDIRLLYGAADGLESFRCHDCGRTFHTGNEPASAEAYVSLDRHASGRIQKIH
jgi:transposase-like protein